MSDAMLFRSEVENKSRNKCSKDLQTSQNYEVSPKSPRYLKKKRTSIHQARRLHSQQSCKDKICNLKHRHSETSETPSEILKTANKISFSSVESKVDLTFSDIRRVGNSSQCTILNELKRSFSLPVIIGGFINSSVSLQKCASLPNISFHISCMQLYLETAQHKEHNTISNSCQSDSDSSDYAGNVCTFSRRSSTSTVRERNNSIDSAFSLISIIDIKEIEEALYAENSGLSNSTWKPHHARSKSDASCNSNYPEIIEGTEVFSLPSSLSDSSGPRKKSIFEGRQIVVPTECFFPRPQQGQSLTSFLSSNEFNISAELDRENAHFCISEALIAAIEHMKCSQVQKVVEEEEESDEEIRKLTQRIRIRRRERQREKAVKSFILLSDGKTDTTTSQSASPPASSHSSDFEVDSIGSEDEVEDIELSAHTESNLSSMKENGLSLSMASLYSDADIHKVPFHQKEVDNKKFQDSESSNNLSAESVALSLLRRFSEKHLPKASELQWLVSEQEAPQRLLPLPDSFPVSPDSIEEEYNLENTRLRGNLEWAPPRPQIIFIIHPNIKRKDILAKQKYRCAGCGMKIERHYIDRFRYCDYFGKYFCQCCHNNSLAYIPGRILWKWDFTKYYVSKFAWDLLDQMFSDPLFSIIDINNNLYKKIRQLDVCRAYRMQLFYLKDFMRTCRKAEMIHAALEKQHHHHILFEPHLYSLSDLVQVLAYCYSEAEKSRTEANKKNEEGEDFATENFYSKVKSGEMNKHLSQLVSHCLEHVKHCILCQAKGFICEICGKDKDIIFPFQLDKVVLCQACGSCFHKRCYKNIKCPKCLRIEGRKKLIVKMESDEELSN